jgi:hypothetical protein
MIFLQLVLGYFVIIKELKIGSCWARYKSAGTCVYTAEINYAAFCKHEEKIEN